MIINNEGNRNCHGAILNRLGKAIGKLYICVCISTKKRRPLLMVAPE